MSTDPLPASSDDWPPGHTYAAVRKAIEKEWRAGEFVLTSEWSAAKSHDIAGTVVRAWVRDGGGLRSIGRDEYERLAANAPSLESGYVAMRFHVCEDARHVVYALIRGPLAAVGGRCWIDPAKPELNSFSWIS